MTRREHNGKRRLSDEKAYSHYLAGVGAFATVGMAADTEIHTDLKTGDYSGALNHASYHLPFIGAGRNAWDALQDNKPWQAAAHAGLLGLEVVGLRAAGKVKWLTFRGEQVAKINRRRYLNANRIAHGKVREGAFAPRKILDADMVAYNSGKFSKVANGDVLINGRLYGLKNGGTTLFPRIGGAHEFVHLTKEQVKAIQLIKTVPPEKLQKAIERSGISSEAAEFAVDFVKKY